MRSALAQTVSDQLVVVVDDGGGLPELPRDGRVVAIRLTRNYGCLGMVRNVGRAGHPVALRRVPR